MAGSCAGWSRGGWWPPTPLSDDVLVAGRRVEAWNDALFSGLRRLHKVPDGFLESLDINQELEKASKSSARLFRTQEEEFIVKGMTASDHESFLQMAEFYAERFTEGSLLTPIYMHFRFRRRDRADGASRKMVSYIAMRNLFPREGTWSARFDLKGCDDDKMLEAEGMRIRAVHRRAWHFWYTRPFWSSDRWKYVNAKRIARELRLSLPEEHREAFLELLGGDVRWLMERGLMDYSLLVGVQRLSEDDLGKENELDADSPTRCPGVAGARRARIETWNQAQPSGRVCFVFRDCELERALAVQFATREQFMHNSSEVIKKAMMKEGLAYKDWHVDVPDLSAAAGATSFPCQLMLRLVKQARDRPIVRVTLGIVDFLQTWTCKKRIASCLKCLEPNRSTVPPNLYGERFYEHFARQWVASEILEPLRGAVILCSAGRLGRSETMLTWQT